MSTTQSNRFQFVLLVDQKITVIGNEMSVQTARFANIWSQIKQISVIFSYLKLLVAVATHNFKWMEISMRYLRGKSAKYYSIKYDMSYNLVLCLFDFCDAHSTLKQLIHFFLFNVWICKLFWDFSPCVLIWLGCSKDRLSIITHSFWRNVEHFNRRELVVEAICPFFTEWL